VVAIAQLTVVPWYLSVWLAIGLGMVAIAILRRIRAHTQGAAVGSDSQRSTRPIHTPPSRGMRPPSTGAAPPVL
jgi:hypothetical protein